MNTTKTIESLLWIFLVLATLILIVATTLEFHVNPAVKLPVILGVVAMDTLVIVNWIFRRFLRKADKA